MRLFGTILRNLKVSSVIKRRLFLCLVSLYVLFPIRPEKPRKFHLCFTARCRAYFFFTISQKMGQKPQILLQDPNFVAVHVGFAKLASKPLSGNNNSHFCSLRETRARRRERFRGFLFPTRHSTDLKMACLSPSQKAFPSPILETNHPHSPRKRAHSPIIIVIQEARA